MLRSAIWETGAAGADDVEDASKRHSRLKAGVIEIMLLRRSKVVERRIDNNVQLVEYLCNVVCCKNDGSDQSNGLQSTWIVSWLP